MRFTKTHRNIVLTTIASVILITASYAVFGWSDPSGAPPESSLPIPLDTGSVDQVKTGAIKVKSLATDALYVNNVQKDTVWDAKEPEISNGTDLQYFRGDKTWQTLNTTTVPEGTNLYFTDARAQAALQTQLNDKAPLADPKFTGNVTMPGTGIWDSSGKVGIGKTTPGYLLDVNGIVNATEIYKNGAPFTIDNPWNKSGSDINYTAGKVGIGTTAPSYKLEVSTTNNVDGIKISGVGNNFAVLNTDTVDGADKKTLRLLPYGSDSVANTRGASLILQGNEATGGGDVLIQPGSTGDVLVSSGKVGIGTTTPTSLLHVFGGSGISQQNDTGKARSVIADGKFYPNRDGSQYYYLSVDTLSIGWSSGAKITTAQGGKGKLTIDPDDTADVIIQPTSGNVGIGTTAPKSGLHVADGKYLQAEDNNAGAPPAADCDSDTERGRISLDTTHFRLYICTGAARGWDFATLSD